MLCNAVFTFLILLKCFFSKYNYSTNDYQTNALSVYADVNLIFTFIFFFHLKGISKNYQSAKGVPWIQPVYRDLQQPLWGGGSF